MHKAGRKLQVLVHIARGIIVLNLIPHYTIQTLSFYWKKTHTWRHLQAAESCTREDHQVDGRLHSVLGNR